MSSRHHSSGHGHGGSSAESKLEKEKTRLIQEKCQAMLNDMLRDEDNKYCVDCDAKGPRWASWNLGLFLCIRCAGIHRNLGVHISKVKSVNLDTWTPEQVANMAQFGNSRARAIYEANLPDTTRRPQTDVALESFIRAKYEHKKYIAKEYVPTPIEKPNWDQEIEEMLKQKKKKSAAGAQEIVLPSSKQFGQKAAAKPAAKSSEEKETKQIDTGANANSTTNNNSTSTSTGNDLAGDLLGLTLDTPHAQASGRPSDPFASPTKEPSASAASDLFLLESGAAAAAKTMSKDSIMSLYAKGAGGGMGLGMAPPQQQQQQQQQMVQAQMGGSVLNSLAGLNLNPFLAPGPNTMPAMGYQGQVQAQPQPQAFGVGGGFGAPQQVPAAQQQQQFMFNNTGLGLGGGTSGLGLTSAQHQFQQFQQSTATALNPNQNPQFTYQATPNPMGLGLPPNPYQSMQMVPGPPGGRSPAQMQNFMFAQPATAMPLQSSPPNFLN